MLTPQSSGGGGGDPTQGTNERAEAEAITTTNDESALLPSQLPSQSNRGALLRGELWATQGNVWDAVRAAKAARRGLDPEASPLLPPMDRIQGRLHSHLEAAASIAPRC
jgi:hypothetical protein